MSTLSKAPLIEAIFELRWAKILRDDTGIHYNFSPAETEILPGQFLSEAKKENFIHYERVNPEAPPFPHAPSHRYRREPNTWPCFQIGPGIFTANQVNDGYSWASYKETILKGLGLLNKAHPDGLENLPGIGVELCYRDGLLFEKGESASQFLKNKLNIGFSQPVEFLRSALLSSELEGNKLSFSTQLKKPEGILVINLAQGLINGRPGFVLDTVVRSTDQKRPEFLIDSLSDWLEDAHQIQKHAFETLINPELHKAFK
jgi:uncharacterized protein (TIGR04255 family)